MNRSKLVITVHKNDDFSIIITKEVNLYGIIYNNMHLINIF